MAGKSSVRTVQKTIAVICALIEKAVKSPAHILIRRDNQRANSSVSSNVEPQIRKYEEERVKLSVLFANGKIGERSYLTATKTLESKIEELKKVKESPVLSQETVAAVHEVGEFEQAVPPKPTALWYLVPFFFGIIGGIIAYVGIKDEDMEMADSLLAFGIIWTVILVVAYFAILSSILSGM